jgi:hypothetical protein
MPSIHLDFTSSLKILPKDKLSTLSSEKLMANVVILPSKSLFIFWDVNDLNKFILLPLKTPRGKCFVLFVE